MYVSERINGTIYFVLGCVVLYFGIKWGDKLIVTESESQEIRAENFIKNHPNITFVDFYNHQYTSYDFSNCKYFAELYVESKVRNVFYEDGVPYIIFVCQNEDLGQPYGDFRIEVSNQNAKQLKTDGYTTYGFVFNFVKASADKSRLGTIVYGKLIDYYKL